MNFYQANLAILVVANACLLVYRHRAQHHKPRHCIVQQSEYSEEVAKKFQRQFLLVYTLVVAADWLQGPYTYAIYKYEKQLTEQRVALLYASGFVSGAVSAPFAGQLADRYGRRAACVAYCICYGITCLTMFSHDLKILFIGRFFGGIATTLLFSVFEAWMITEYHLLQLDEAKTCLSQVFANMTTISTITAICSGVLGDSLVQSSGSRLGPFIASFVCCIGTSILILATWRENYGSRAKSKEPSEAQEWRCHMLKAIMNPKIMTLTFASCCFEGTMYLFVFFWSAALKSARANSGNRDELPFGLIFSSFMCVMMAGSNVSATPKVFNSDSSVLNTLMFIFAIASGGFAASAILNREHIVFWAFCVIEGCIGAYFPKMALLKSNTIDDSVRGGVYSTLRLPLNIFVVVAHSLDQDGRGIMAQLVYTSLSLTLEI
ncbi:major facilitator superfamily transporter [Trichoderma arundinaceum]|uniref:Molybdate-anion transporter n=1 Tax=Trichoderma arundinaceum TaxID=490622 RepID=A0A395NCQ1_TRIAR|nr:major facilitator superfamily transporter [Trichoderma arundinaceum]